MIGMFDVLGFSSLLDSLGLKGISSRVSQLEHELRMHFQWEARFAMFSDTILLYSHPIRAAEDDAQEFMRQTQIDAFLRWCSLLQALSFIVGLPLRGGVAFGECVLAPSRGRLVGQPVIDAFKLSEDQDWVGVALHDSCIPRLLRYEPPYAGVTVQREIPLKDRSSAQTEWTLDWPHILPRRQLTPGALSQSSLRDALCRQVEDNRDSRYAKRWLRTWDYFESRTSMERELPPEGAQIRLSLAGTD